MYFRLHRTLTVWRALHRLLLTQKHRTTKIRCTVPISRHSTTGATNISTSAQWRPILQQLHLLATHDTRRQLFVPEKVLIQIRHSLCEFHKQIYRTLFAQLTLSPNYQLSTKQHTKDSCATYRCTSNCCLLSHRLVPQSKQ